MFLFHISDIHTKFWELRLDNTFGSTIECFLLNFRIS